jgi:hypothetical protein
MLHLRVPAAVRIITLLFLWPLLSAGQSVKMQQSAKLLSHAFAQRLEASFQYQEAILPAGTTNRESYLKVGHRRYLLTETVRLPRDNQLQQDNYLVQPRNGVLRTSFQSRYLIEPDPDRSTPGQRVSYYQAYVSTDQGIEPTKALLLQNFDPLRLLDERPATGQNAVFYVLDNASAGQRDTLASYQLECPDSSRFCLLTLDERRDARSHRWHENHVSTQTWTSTWQGSRQEQLVSERKGQCWTRQYRTAHDFTETLEAYGLSQALGGGAGWHATVYERHYRRRGKHRAVDTYTLSSYPDMVAPLKLSVLHVAN